MERGGVGLDKPCIGLRDRQKVGPHNTSITPISL